MKPILYVSPLPPPYGGIATWTALIFKHGLPSALPLALVDTKIGGKRNIFDQAAFSFIEFLRFTKIIFSFFTQLIIHRPALIHLSSALSSVGIFRDAICLSLAKVLHIPIISHFHGNLPDFNTKRFLGLSGLTLKYLIKFSTLNIVENEFSYQYLIRQGLSRRIKTLPNFVEDELFSQNSMPNKKNDIPKAIFAGGITGAKGAIEILQLAKRFPQIAFHLYGKLHADMSQLFSKVPANVSLHGPVAHSVLLQAMRESDFLLFPSYTEGFPLAVVEAMAMGLPVIATKVGAIPEMIDEGKGGFLSEPKQLEALQAAIEKWLNLADKGLGMGEYNRKKAAAQYRFSKVIEDIETIYLKLIARKNPCVE